jgi:hypothetical protein
MTLFEPRPQLRDATRMTAIASAPAAPLSVLVHTPDPSLLWALLPGLPAAIVALLVAVIAYRQYEVAKAKLNLDLFDKRFAIFDQTWEIFSETATKGTREKQRYGFGSPFNNFHPQARFLFGKEIADYLELAFHNWNELHLLEGEREDLAAAAAHAARVSELKSWFFEEARNGCKDKFGKFLNFERWK